MDVTNRTEHSGAHKQNMLPMTSGFLLGKHFSLLYWYRYPAGPMWIQAVYFGFALFFQISKGQPTHVHMLGQHVLAL